MKLLAVEPLAISDVKRVRYARFADERGYFTETARPEQLAPSLASGAPDGFTVQQINESASACGVVRGLHLQWRPYQGKLVRAVAGRFLDVALDVRLGSPTFGQAVVAELVHQPEAAEAQWVWVPPGFAHGLVFDREAGVAEYLCTSAWSPQTEGAVNIRSTTIDWSRAELALAQRVTAWLAADAARLSAKDAQAPSLAEWVASPAAAEFVFDRSAPFGCRGGD